MAYIVNGKKIADILSGDSVKPLESTYEIEDLLSAIKGMRDKLEFLDKLKKARSQAINAEISKISDQSHILEETVRLTLEDNNKKSLNFPGIGKVTSTERKGKWVISDQEQFVKDLEDNDAAAYDKVVSKEDLVNKKEANAIFDIWEEVGKIPSYVKRDPSTKSTKFSFDENFIVEEEISNVQKQESKKADYDGLEI